MNITDRLKQYVDELVNQTTPMEFAAKVLAEIQTKYALPDADFASACHLVLSERFSAVAERKAAMAAEVETIASRAAEWGRGQADRDILSTPLPWSRRTLLRATKGVEDHLADHFSKLFETGSDFTKDMVCEVIHRGRVGFVERIAELSRSASPEVSA